jgi:anti-sigma factor RsiW
MNSPAHDHPDLTAYALGELAPADAARVRNWLAQSPEAAAEFERIQQTVEALQAAPALPKRALHPRQRETVLAMGQTPVSTARPKKVAPFLGFRRPAGSGTSPTSMAWRLVKYAAAACLMAGAFMLGQKTAMRMTPVVASNDDSSNPETFTANVEPSKPSPVALPAPLQPADASPQVQAPAVPAPVVAEAKDRAPVSVSQAALAAPGVVAETKAPVTSPPKAPVSPPTATVTVAAKAPPASTPGSGAGSQHGFAQASVSPEAQLTVRPQFIRPRTLPVPHEFAGVVLASPMPLDAKPAPVVQPKPEPQPPLEIHTWKAEFASCPWDSNRRLMRLVVQLPVEQPGIESNDRDYKLVAKFDPFQVQGFRLVTEKQMRPTGTGTQATCFAWYEIIPTRNFNPSLEKPVTLGTVSIEQPRGATSNLAPLKLVDKGLAWKDAREDFVFETAMIGWNMLLNGTENIGGLNSKFVLDLAEQTRGEDARGERSKFINAVKQAQRAVGM